jgi:iron complex outermembrane receptor protein
MRAGLLVTTGLLLIHAGSAAAQTASGAPTAPAASDSSAPSEGLALSEIVVTATKRELNLDDVPAVITAVSAASLQQGHISDLTDLNGLVPALEIRPNNTDVALFLRGVGHPAYSPQAENSIALNLDGVYLSRPAEGLNAFFDVNRVEALSGPQGTLYGRNATGGVVNIVSNSPTRDPEGYLAVTGANYGRVDVEGVYSGPLTDNLQIRVGGYEHRQFDGFGDDHFTGTQNSDLHEDGGKIALQYEPTERLTLVLRVDGYHANDHDAGYFYDGPSGRLPVTTIQHLGGQTYSNPFDNDSDLPNSRQVTLAGTSLDVKYEVSPALTLKSLTAYNYVAAQYATDLDQTSATLQEFFLVQHADHYSEELSAAINVGHLFANLGLYYFGELNRSQLLSYGPLYYAFPARGIPIPAYIAHPGSTGYFNEIGDGKTNAEAIYGNASYDVTSRLTLGVGLRYSHEEKQNIGDTSYVVTPLIPFDGTKHSDGLTPAFNAIYKLDSNLNLYGSASRGFKSGEWVAGTSDYAQPEFVWDYELGVKGHAFDHHLDFTLGGFYYDYKNLQVEILQGVSGVLINVPSSEFYGLEGSVRALLPADLELTTAISALHTRLGTFYSADPNLPGNPLVDLVGNRAPNAPAFQASLTLSRKMDFGRSGSGVATVNYSWQDSAYLDIFNVKDNSYRPSYSLLNASYLYNLPGPNWSILLWGKNLTNKIVVDTATVSSQYNFQLANWSNPRTYGATLKFSF